jgi:hypothetical protein
MSSIVAGVCESSAEDFHEKRKFLSEQFGIRRTRNERG